MSITKLSDQLYIAPQLTQAESAAAGKLGIKSVICNRPDGEEPDQPAFAQVQQWLADAGIWDVAHQPVTAPTITNDDVARFQQLLADSPAPVLAYCRTGTRCTLLWSLRQVQNGTPVAEVIATAQAAGIDLSNFSERLHNAAQA